jgi:hypothetical protein
MVAPWQASSAALRVAEGNMTNNIRAAERFLATIPGVGRALQVAFPVVGAVALLGVFARMGNEVVDFIKKTNRIPQALETAFRESLLSGQSAADELQKENDALDNQIAKLEGRPQNNLATAIDDARIAADKLEQSLMRDNREIAELLKQNQIGSLGELLTGKGRTTAVAGDVNYWNQELANKAKDFDKAVHAFGPDSVQAKSAQTALAQRRQAAEANMQMEIDVRKPSPDRAANITGDQDPNLNIAQGYLAILQQQDRMDSLSGQHEQKKSVADALTHARELQAAAKERGAQQMQAWEKELSEQKSKHVMSLDEDADFWQKRADSVTKGSMLYTDALKKANDLRAASQVQYQQEFTGDVIEKMRSGEAGDSSSDRVHAALQEQYVGDDTHEREIKRQTEEGATRAFAAAEQQRKAADSLAEEAIRLQEQSGQLSRAGAAQALMTVHQESFANWSAASASFSAQFPNLAVPGATQALQEYGKQSQQDEAAQEATTSLGALREATDRMTQAFTDLPAHLTQLMTSAISGFNEAFSSAVMAHTTSGVEYRRGITNAVGGQFRSLGAKGLDSALQMGEGGLMSKLGFGKSKPTGTQSDPLFVRLIAAAGAAGGTLDSTGAGSLLLSALGASGPAGTTGSSKGSFLSTVLPALTQMIPHRASGGPIPANTPAIVGENGPELFMSSRAGHIVPNSALGGALSKVLPALTHMIPGFASGGPIPSNMPAIVGENGPELFMPASSGRIVPNGDFGGGAGGGDTHVHVDARGAHDPTATEAAVHRAMKSYLPHLDARTIATVRAYNKARPGTARL